MSFKERFAKCLDRLYALASHEARLELYIGSVFIDAYYIENANKIKAIDMVAPFPTSRKNQLDRFVFQFEQWLDQREHKLTGAGGKAQVIMDEAKPRPINGFI